MNIFEVATRERLRFNFRGQISVEDLYDLSVQNLDTIFKELNSQLKQVKEESLLGEKTQQDRELDTKIEIVKYIVNVKLKETETRLKSEENKKKKQQILEILSTKQNADLENKSEEELKAMLDQLD